MRVPYSGTFRLSGRYASRIQTIERAFGVLRAVAGHGDAVGVSEVARTTGLAKSTCSRILASLEELGMVERADGAGRYVVGAGLTALAGSGSAPSSLREAARPFLQELVDRFGECAAVAVLDGGEGLYVEQVQSPGHVQVTDWTGHRLPLHTIAAGQALMGSWTDAEVARYASGGLERLTDDTVTTLADLRRRVAEVRRTGVAWTGGDFAEELTGVGAAVVPPGGGPPLAALTVFGPTFRFPGEADRADIGLTLLDSAARLAARLTG